MVGSESAGNITLPASGNHEPSGNAEILHLIESPAAKFARAKIKFSPFGPAINARISTTAVHIEGIPALRPIVGVAHSKIPVG